MAIRVKELIKQLLECDMNASVHVSLEPRPERQAEAKSRDGLTPPVVKLMNDNIVVHLRTWAE